MSAAEVGIILIVGLVVVGPKRLPEMMRKAGQWVAKLRRLSTDLRSQSGIDRILREEGLDKEIRELRALRESLSKSAVLESLMQAANAPAAGARPPPRALPPKKPDSAQEGAAAPALPATASAGETATAASSDEAPAAIAAEATAAVAIGSDGSATTSAAAALIKPAEGSVARAPRAPAPTAPINGTPLPSFREREYPGSGPDHYDALPDDLEDEEIDPSLAAGADVLGEAAAEGAA